MADHSSLSHCSIAATSAAVGAVVAVGVERGFKPLKWPQKPFYSIASWKRTAKIAQFRPVASSFGTDEDKESDNEVVVMDMVSRIGLLKC